ncbi:alpha/beta hydrolase-fold protein [Chishuiella sp.]|uniref:alpha/beta hydrolase n=1 Tax=Chishuiella sp. TaxID=1969467 RepID=UPI0028B0C05B|nr:alpha/beta hydrolase-fold protein [Chishuiella sp.]
MKNLLSVIITFFFSLLHAQTPYTIGDTYTIHSNILNEDRIIDVQLPQNYSNQDFAKGKYPVVYVLDGDTNFSLVGSLERFSTKFLFRSQPEMIVVGIRNIDRTKDYTPTKSLTKSKDNKLQYETSGGADNFLNFINNELKPFINKKFRTTGFNIIHGHSFGGLFAVYTLVNHPDSFNAYIAIDPSLWWDNKIVFKQAQEKFKTTTIQNKSLYVALAHEKPDAQKDRLEHGNTIRKFCEELLPTTQIYSSWKYYPDYNHGSVPIPASYDAMVALFKGIELPIRDISQKPELVQETYVNFSKKMNYTFLPEESLLLEVIKYTKRINQEENTSKILDYSLKIYPDSKQLKTMKKNEK